MTVWRATPDDLPEILRMAEEFSAGTGLDVPFDSESCEITALNLMTEESGLLLMSDGAMIGGLVFPHFFNVGVLMAQELFWWVDKDKRGGGVGKELLTEFENWARAIGAKNVCMIALQSQKPVGKLYQRRGYKPLEATFVRPLWD